MFESEGESFDALYTFKQSARVDRDWAIDSAPHVRSSALRRQKPLKPCDFPREIGFFQSPPSQPIFCLTLESPVAMVGCDVPELVAKSNRSKTNALRTEGNANWG